MDDVWRHIADKSRNEIIRSALGTANMEGA
jgi:hypothetical protein